MARVCWMSHSANVGYGDDEVFPCTGRAMFIVVKRGEEALVCDSCVIMLMQETVREPGNELVIEILNDCDHSSCVADAVWLHTGKVVKNQRLCDKHSMAYLRAEAGALELLNDETQASLYVPLVMS